MKARTHTQRSTSSIRTNGMKDMILYPIPLIYDWNSADWLATAATWYQGYDVTTFIVANKVSKFKDMVVVDQ